VKYFFIEKIFHFSVAISPSFLSFSLTLSPSLLFLSLSLSLSISLFLQPFTISISRSHFVPFTLCHTHTHLKQTKESNFGFSAKPFLAHIFPDHFIRSKSSKSFKIFSTAVVIATLEAILCNNLSLKIEGISLKFLGCSLPQFRLY